MLRSDLTKNALEIYIRFFCTQLKDPFLSQSFTQLGFMTLGLYTEPLPEGGTCEYCSVTS
jgi:hypothetical protein